MKESERHQVTTKSRAFMEPNRHTRNLLRPPQTSQPGRATREAANARMQETASILIHLRRHDRRMMQVVERFFLGGSEVSRDQFTPSPSPPAICYLGQCYLGQLSSRPGHDSPRTPNVHISWPQHFKHNQNSTRRPPREEE